MNRIIFSAACLLILASCTGTIINSQTNEEFAATIAKEDVQIVDVRSSEEFAERHLPNALNIDFQKDDFIEKALSMLDKKRPVAVYCMKGIRSKLAGKKLAKEGYTVFELDNGLGKWKPKLEHFTFYSKSLKEPRELTVYFPENFTEEKSYNVIFCTDGQFINEQYKRKLDSLFNTKTVNPFVIIGVNSNERMVPNSQFGYRNYEYIENMGNFPNDDSTLNFRFKRHLDFFVNEVDKYVKEKLKLKTGNKYFYGVSNGAGFGITMSKYYPELFSKYIIYSTGGESYENLKWDPEKYPFFIIRCGDKEPEPLIESSKKLSEFLSGRHYEHIFEIYNGGHKREDWMNLFIRDLGKL
jgi:rhodanese-related sulfurtransferase/enterochelin esterase-like enzyme